MESVIVPRTRLPVFAACSKGHNIAPDPPTSGNLPVILAPHSPVLGPPAGSAGDKTLFLYGIPAGLDLEMLRDAILETLRDFGIVLLKHLDGIDINPSLGTCLINLDSYGWASFALHHLRGSGLSKLQKKVGGFDLNVDYNSQKPQGSSNELAQKVILTSFPGYLTDLDIFNLFIVESSAQIVPIRILRTADREAIVTFRCREHVIFTVCRLEQAPLVIGGQKVEVQWMKRLPQES